MIALRVAAVALASSGTVMIVVNHGPHDPIFFLGLTLLCMSSVVGTGAYLLRLSTRLDDAFEHGVRVGYRKACRIAPSLRAVKREDIA